MSAEDYEPNWTTSRSSGSSFVRADDDGTGSGEIGECVEDNNLGRASDYDCDGD